MMPNTVKLLKRNTDAEIPARRLGGRGSPFSVGSERARSGCFPAYIHLESPDAPSRLQPGKAQGAKGPLCGKADSRGKRGKPLPAVAFCPIFARIWETHREIHVSY